MRRQFLGLMALCAFSLMGCGVESGQAPSAKWAPATSEEPKGFASPEIVRSRARATDRRAMLADGSVVMTVAMQTPAEAPPEVSRKVVYDAVLDLLADSIEPAVKRIPEMVEDAHGYIAEQNMTGSPGSRRTQHWKLRIPVDRFESFVEGVMPLGELEQYKRTAQDVTAEYYDVEARIKNKKVEEQTLTRILEERSGKLEDVLKIEIELSRVRGEIEQMQGRIRVLDNLSSLATLTLNVRERDNFAPAAPVVADFPTQIARTWHDSIHRLTELGKGLVLFVVRWALGRRCWRSWRFWCWFCPATDGTSDSEAATDPHHVGGVDSNAAWRGLRRTFDGSQGIDGFKIPQGFSTGGGSEEGFGFRGRGKPGGKGGFTAGSGLGARSGSSSS